jgi:cell division protein FtsW
MRDQAAAKKAGTARKKPPAALVEAKRRRDERSAAPRARVSGGKAPLPRAKASGGRAPRGKAALKVVPKERPATRIRTVGLTGTGYAILGVTLIMFLYGMVMIFSASSGLAFQVYGSSYYFLLRQAIWFGIGLVAMIAMIYMDYHHVAEASPILVGLSLFALAAVPFIGAEVFGSRRSINYGPMVFQPSELAKMSLLLFAVYIYNRRRGKLDGWREIIMPVLLVTAIACILIILEPDLGTMLIAAISVFLVLFLAGAPLRRLAILAMAGVGATAIFIFTSAYRKARFLAFLDPWSAPREGGFHIIQSMVALGSGSVSGLGLGMSRQKFFYLPNAHTDFIFSIIGEELGLIGTLAVLGLFVSFVYLGLKAARGAPDSLGQLMATGITCMIGIQAFVNMGAATGGLPITGVTLPFFSYGGSSLVICMCLAGILINISRQEAGAGTAYNGRKERESGDMRGRNRRPSTPSSRPGRGARIA